MYPNFYNVRVPHYLSSTRLFLYTVTLNILCYTVISITLYRLLCTEVEMSIELFQFSQSLDIPLTFLESSFLNFLENQSDFLFLDTRCMTLRSQSVCYDTDFLSATLQTSYYLFNVSIDCESILNIKISTKVLSEKLVSFTCLNDSLYVIPGEPILLFFRLTNLTSTRLNCISVYNIFPPFVLPYIVKIQCFCFDNITVMPFETIELPVLLYCDPTWPLLEYTSIFLYYVLIPSTIF